MRVGGERRGRKKKPHSLPARAPPFSLFIAHVRVTVPSYLCSNVIMMQSFPDREVDEGEAGNSEQLVTFVGSGCSLENVASHDGGGAVNHALVLIVYGFRIPAVLWC